MTFRELLESRGITQDAAALLAGVDSSTISRICAGHVRARPKTIVRIAKALRISPQRMQEMCDAHYLAAHPGELVLV